MLLTGTFSRSIDDKLRLAIPKRLRAALACAEGGTMYVAPGTDQSLGIYTEEGFAALADRVAAMSPTRPDVRAFTRIFYTLAERVEVDSQGRIRIPPKLAEMVHLARKAVLLGVQDHLELWPEDRWEAYLAEKQPHYDEIAEAAFGAAEPAVEQSSGKPVSTNVYPEVIGGPVSRRVPK